MPGSKIRPSKFSAAKKKVSRKQRAAVSNQKHLKKGIACSKDWKAPPQSLLLANFKQDWTFADVATWSDLKAWKIDPKKGFSFLFPTKRNINPHAGEDAAARDGLFTVTERATDMLAMR